MTTYSVSQPRVSTCNFNTPNSDTAQTILTLEIILTQPALFEAFETYLARIHAHESLVFLRELWTLRKKPSITQKDVEQLMKDFILPGGNMELNISSQSRRNLIKDVKAIKAWDKATMKVFRSVEKELGLLLRGRVSEFNGLLNQVLATKLIRARPSEFQKRVVVVGGGFAGLACTEILEKMPRFHVTLIDTKEHFEYTPATIKSLTNPEAPVRFPHSDYVKNGFLVVGRVEDVFRDYVRISNKKIPFDYLVIATGSSYSSLLKSTRISTCYKSLRPESDFAELKVAQKVVVVGGGYVGVEVAAQIAHDFPEKSVSLLEAGPQLLKNCSAAVHKKVAEKLQKLGVEIHLNEQIIDTVDNTFVSDTGKVFSYDKYYVATGNKPLSGLVSAKSLDSDGYIKVKPTLQLQSFDNIFAAGDVTNVQETKTVNAALCAGTTVARNICRLEKDKAPLVQGENGTRKGGVPSSQLLSLGGKTVMMIQNQKTCYTSSKFYAAKDWVEKKFTSQIISEGLLFCGSYGRRPEPLGIVSDNINN